MSKNKKKNNKITSLDYQGHVSIKLMHGNKVYKKTRVHNIGKLPLFEYLAYCLSGTYTEIKAPRYIRAFHTSDENWNSSSPTTSMGISYSSVEVKLLDGNYVTIFSFLIPGSSLSETAETTMLALYSQENYTNLDNPSAYFYLGSGQENIFNNIDSSTNVVISWEMSINNKLSIKE